MLTKPYRSSIADKASPSPCKLCEQFLPQDILEKRIQCMSSPTNLWERKPRSKTSDRKRVRCVQVLVLTYAELDISKPGTPHHQRQGSRRSIQHPPTQRSRTWHLLKIFREEGRPKEREVRGKCSNTLSYPPPEHFSTREKHQVQQQWLLSVQADYSFTFKRALIDLFW